MSGMTALIGFAAWTLFLLAIVVVWRGYEVLRGRRADSWTRGSAAASPPLVCRAEHAHLNCLENLPVFAVIVLGAYALERTAVVDGLAAWVLWARIAQSAVHLAGVSHGLVLLRAGLFGVQYALFAWMLWSLLA